MTVYTLQLLILILLVILSQSNSSEKAKKVLFFMGTFLLGFVLFARVTSIGSDLGRYRTHFNICGKLSLQGIMDTYHCRNIGYYIYNHFMYYLTNGDYQWFIAITSLLTFIPVIILILKTVGSSDYALFSFFCFGYYAFQFSGLKQSLAMGILCFAYLSIVNNKRLPFYMLLLIAALFHMPCLVFLPAYELTHQKFNRTYKFLAFVAVGLMIILRNQLVSLLQNEYESIVVTEGTIIAGGKVLLIFSIIIFGYFFWLPKNIDNEDSNELSVLWRLMIVAGVIQTFATFGNVFERLADYYFFFIIIYMPYLVSPNTTKEKCEFRASLNKSSQLITSVVISLALIGFYWLNFRNTPGLNPYGMWIHL